MQFKTNPVCVNPFLTLAHQVHPPCQEELNLQVEGKTFDPFQKAMCMLCLPLPELIRSQKNHISVAHGGARLGSAGNW